MEAAAADPSLRTVHDMVAHHDKSSLLYHLCACSAPEFREASVGLPAGCSKAGLSLL